MAMTLSTLCCGSCMCTLLWINRFFVSPTFTTTSSHMKTSSIAAMRCCKWNFQLYVVCSMYRCCGGRMKWVQSLKTKSNQYACSTDNALIIIMSNSRSLWLRAGRPNEEISGSTTTSHASTSPSQRTKWKIELNWLLCVWGKEGVLLASSAFRWCNAIYG